MCCLGFLGVACEVEDSALDQICYPVHPTRDNRTKHTSEKWPSFLFKKSSWRNINNSEVNAILAAINDKAELSEFERESQLTIEFGKYGWEVEFIN